MTIGQRKEHRKKKENRREIVLESISEIFAFMFLDEVVLLYGNVQMWPGEQSL